MEVVLLAVRQETSVTYLLILLCLNSLSSAYKFSTVVFPPVVCAGRPRTVPEGSQQLKPIPITALEDKAWQHVFIGLYPHHWSGLLFAFGVAMGW